MNAIDQLFVLIFLLSIGFGISARRTEFCPLGGIADIIQHDHWGRFYMYLFAIAVAMFGVTLLEYFNVINFDNTRPPYRMSPLRWPGYVFGGLLFGIGMTFCRGCGMKNMLNLGGGNLKTLVAILGMGSAAVVLLYVEGAFSTLFLSWMNPLTPDLAAYNFHQTDLGTFFSVTTGLSLSDSRLLIGLLLVAVLLFTVLRSADFRQRPANLIGGLLVGLCIVTAFYLSGGTIGDAAQQSSDFMDQPQNGMGIQSYTFIRPMGDLLYVASNPNYYLVTFGLVAFLGVGVGSLLVSLLTRHFKIEWFSSPLEALRYLFGGLLVGMGGILGLGCTLGQGVAGTSTLALGSFINLFSLIIGAIIGIKLQAHFMDDHVMPSAQQNTD